jgi:arylformamidase
MKLTLEHPKHGSIEIDWNSAIDISSQLLRTQHHNPNAYYLSPPTIEPVRVSGFVGSVAEGGPVNCEHIILEPHGNGTHTECVGHISLEEYRISACWRTPFAFALVVSANSIPDIDKPDGEILDGSDCLRKLDALGYTPSVIVLRLKGISADDKQFRQWSGTNPPYLYPQFVEELRLRGIEHLMVELPSIDPEVDGGLLLAHHSFWNYPENPRTTATITEMIVVPDRVPDGEYVIHVSLLSIESDASPSTITLLPFATTEA